MTMVPEIKEKWVAALRSGDYKQTYGRLHNKEGYCCLGVVCEITENPDWVWSETYGSYTYGKDLPIGALTKETLDAIGLTNTQQTFLAQSNDDGTRFRDIADWIEENL